MNYDWKIGDRVQIEDKDDTIRVGVLTAVKTEQVERTRYNHSYSVMSTKAEKYSELQIVQMTVKWDDGVEEIVKQYGVHHEDSEMERSFRLACLEAQERIEEKLRAAMAALREAEKIADEAGIPFSAGISPLSQSYIPSSLEEKFPNVDRDFINDITGSYGEYDGWQHSAVC
jgi:hypothetical protein